eukprot:TRINITY_DN14070_c0_g1_i1.p1 TRINITY_DN14070_c0_g1~~TRINITY_DN14070_c0_g1_i1.p1  ORF type:complete len:129 (-),score=19.64 TRINITY_DN14070_c0_g1_i1:84-470(-)
MPLVAVAVIGKDNNPLYVKSFSKTDDDLKFHYIAHSSLDMFEAKEPRRQDSYLGLLFPIESYRVYGYVTNTRNKFVVIVDDADPKENDLKQIFRKFASAFTDAICNPFYVVGQPIASVKFQREIDALA